MKNLRSGLKCLLAINKKGCHKRGGILIPEKSGRFAVCCNKNALEILWLLSLISKYFLIKVFFSSLFFFWYFFFSKSHHRVIIMRFAFNSTVSLAQDCTTKVPASLQTSKDK